MPQGRGEYNIAEKRMKHSRRLRAAVIMAVLTGLSLPLSASADVVVHDGLVDPRVLDYAPVTAQRISVAKRRARHTLLAMVADIRVVLIKLAWRTQTMHYLPQCDEAIRRQIARLLQSALL